MLRTVALLCAAKLCAGLLGAGLSCAGLLCAGLLCAGLLLAGVLCAGLWCAGWLFAGLAISPAVAAETWPTRPIKLVVPFSAAGTADLLARIVADRLGPILGQPVVVEHRPGAGGIVGQEQV